MFHSEELTPEQEEELIQKLAKKIHNHGLDAAVIWFASTVKPLSHIGSQFGRAFIFPYLWLMGEETSLWGDRFFTTFYDKENYEKLMNVLEEMSEEDKNKKKVVEEMNKSPSKKNWRRLLPF